MFWKKKKPQTPESAIILGMIMLLDEKPVNKTDLIKDFETIYGKDIKDASGDDAAFTFTVDGEMIAVGHMPAPIPLDDLQQTARYAYNWVSAPQEIIEHKSHLIVSIVSGSQDQIKRYRLFTQVLASLLRTTDALGVYKGHQSLLIPKEDYLNETELMDDTYLPLNLWIYFGLRATETGNCGYTYGLTAFDKKELEVVHSKHTLEEIRGFLFNVSHYVLEYDVTFKSGQTVGGSQDEKIKITSSKGHLVEGESFKLGY
jgi:hypothetical protein